MNIYEKYIKSLENQSIEGYFEYHHIIPRHIGGNNDISNLIKLKYRQHTLAHLLLYRVYKRPQDLCAYKLMRGLSESRKSEISKMIGENHKLSGHIYRLGQSNKETNWINLIKTKESLSKGGKKSGQIAKETGQILTIQTEESCRKGGIAAGNLARERGQIQALAKRKGLYVLIMPDGTEFQHVFQAVESTGIPSKKLIDWCKMSRRGYSRRVKTQEELDNRWRV